MPNPPRPLAPGTTARPSPSERGRTSANRRVRLDACEAIERFGRLTSRNFTDAHELLIHAGLLALGHEGVTGKPDPFAHPDFVPQTKDLAKT